jgi:putative FmdB family regulatory protein
MEKRMPTYEYACQSCGEHIDVVQSFTDDPLTVCPTCQGSLRKVFGSVGIVFKGSGFYKTDSRTASSKASSDAGAATKSDSGSSDTAKPTTPTTSSDKADTATKKDPAPTSSTSPPPSPSVAAAS